MKPRIRWDDLPLFPSEELIARLVLDSRADQWPSVAKQLEKRGFPKVHPFYGGRYWPHVLAFIEADMTSAGAPSLVPDQDANITVGRHVIVRPYAPDGKETFDAEKAEAARSGQRHDRRHRPVRA